MTQLARAPARRTGDPSPNLGAGENFSSLFNISEAKKNICNVMFFYVQN